MAETRKTVGKYLRYSFGELILLVVGILLALQINNYNDNRKSKGELRTILTIVRNDLSSNLKDADFLIKNYETEMSLLNKMLDSATVDSIIDHCPRCFSLNTSFADLVLNQRGLELLKQYKSQHSVSSDSLILFIDALYTDMTKYNKTMVDLINVDVLDNLKFYRDNFDWFEKFLEGDVSRETAEEILDNVKSRNRLLHYRVLIGSNYLRLLKSFKEEGEIIKQKLDKRLAE
ncbi:MAG: hypothetical protein JJ975_10655 [Bacteroidia bacterium]|nr:hypothetical protein [Bacteroidia bacterium]